ncbi:MAG: hemolysin [Gammaproteobacteria bacterium]|nr:hemolysin [Gammaproteobacteria bacterium]|tara:strand:+ start:337 stop:1524 length:1188 start_codon:yes stop_codon:yes gene_type:complete
MDPQAIVPPGGLPDGSLTLLIVYASVALGFSFLCSIAEAVLLSASPSYAESLKESSPRSGRLLAKLKANIDRPLAAILTLNTIAHTVGAVGVGAEAGALWGSVGVGIASGVMTLLILVASEIIPKTIGAVFWRALAAPTAHGVALLIKLVLPVVWLSEAITRSFINSKEAERVTRDEIAAVAEMSKDSGELRTVENRILNNLLRLHSLTVNDIMTPRTVILALQEDITVGALMQDGETLPVSRIPIYTDTVDNVTGFVLKSDILLAQARDQPETRLKELRRDLSAIPASASLSALFDHFIHERDHLSLVVDEYGGTDGLVSMEDLVETLLGIEIVDEADMAEDMQRLARQHWAKRASALGFQIPMEKDGATLNDKPQRTPEGGVPPKVAAKHPDP